MSYQKAVEHGKINYLSPSAISVASPLETGCPRKWWYQYLGGLRSPQTAAQAKGEAVHKEIELYLDSRGKTPLQGAIQLRDWLDNLLRDGDVTFQQEIDLPATVTILDGIRLKGRIDLLVSGLDGKPRTVVDWKTTGKITSARPSAEVLYSIQGSVYAAATGAAELYFCYLDMASRFTPPVWRGGTTRQCRPLEDIEDSIACLPAAAATKNPDEVPANTNACGQWGGCPARHVCKAYTTANSSTVTGRQAQHLIQIISKAREPKTEERTVSSYFDDLIEESAPAPATDTTDEIVHWLRQIRDLGIGMPALTGEVLTAWTTAEGLTVQGDALAGNGKLGRFTMASWPVEGDGRTSLQALMTQLRANTAYASRLSDYEAAKIQRDTAPAPAKIQRDTDIGDALAAASLAQSARIEPETEAPKKRGRKSKIVEPVAEAATPVVEPSAWTGEEIAAEDAALAARKPKAVEPEPTVITYDPAEAKAALDAIKAPVVETCPTTRILYIDCLPAAGAVTNLAQWVSLLAGFIRETYGAVHSGKDESVAYGAWRDRCVEAVRISPPTDTITFVSEPTDPLALQIVNAYRDYVVKSGGLVVAAV